MMLEEKRARLNAIRQLLTNTDYKAIKHSEGMISDEDYKKVKSQRQEWRDEINELEQEIAKEESEEELV